jgi:hypothetical protein
MQVIQECIYEQDGKGFSSEQECAEWAKENVLDLVVLSRSTRRYYYVNHRGDILEREAWLRKYNEVLFINKIDDNGKYQKIFWEPKGLKYYDNAKVNGESADRDRQPLYHRDYATPSGYFDKTKGTFNIAKPVPCFAKETGRDTSHIYRFINAIAGECTMHLLAWLRMKMCSPTEKTQVVPIIVSKTQGTGKSTFAEVICKGLFGKDNVLVTDQYDSGSRFNADYADALIVCHEEKEYEDKRNTAAALKSRATATMIRKENKGLDPVYQESYTDFIMTSNKEVPVKFEDDTDQRRFMVMEADADFTRKTSTLADEIFTKLYGMDGNNVKQGTPFVEDVPLIQQFKHELFTNENIKNTELRKFPHTDAYARCRTLPRTSEAAEIESIVKSLAPFIKETLLRKTKTTSVVLSDSQTLKLVSFVQSEHAFQYVPEQNGEYAYVALCNPLVFYDQTTNKPFTHSVVERGVYDCNNWLMSNYGIIVSKDASPLAQGFFGVQGRHRMAPASRFRLVDEAQKRENIFDPGDFKVPKSEIKIIERIGERLRVNGEWHVDPNGEFETVNEMKPGTNSLKNKTNNVQYMDTFLLEADDTDKETFYKENVLLDADVSKAETVFRERLAVQKAEAERLCAIGTVARVVYSGGKSIHMLIRVLDAPLNVEEYKWLHSYLCSIVSKKLQFDAQTSDPARLTRAPITFERTFTYHGKRLTGTQYLIYENWNNIYNIRWRVKYDTWKNRPLRDYEQYSQRKLLPTKEQYVTAMLALLQGTFWTDTKFNGQRQQCFFPAYRLCRSLGYSHEKLWSKEGILDGLQFYSKPNEIDYWRTRETSDIIKSIDKEFDSAQD